LITTKAQLVLRFVSF